MATAITKAQGQELQPSTAPNALNIVQYAIQQGAGIDVIERLMAIKEREEANEARRAYDAAMAQFKAQPPRITKNRQVKFGNTEYFHATLDHVTDMITAALSRVGLSHRFEVQQAGEMVTVTCVLRHELGHSECTTLSGPIDKSGSKNAIQSIGSTVTYLQRYTLLAAVGMATGGQDDDGQTASSGQQMSDQQFLPYQEAIEAARTREELKAAFARAYKAAEDMGDKQSMADFIRLKDARKAGMQ